MMVLDGRAIAGRGPRGEEFIDDTFVVCFNAHHEPLVFTLPPAVFGARWQRVIDTADPDLRQEVGAIAAGGALHVTDRSVVVLQLAELAGQRDRSSDGISLAHT
jgi:glycogen operon protein